MHISPPYPRQGCRYGTSRYAVKCAPRPRRSRRHPPAQSWRHPALSARRARLSRLAAARHRWRYPTPGRATARSGGYKLGVKVGFFQHVPRPYGDQWSITLSVPVMTNTPLSRSCFSGMCSVPIGTVEAMVTCCAAMRVAISSTCCSFSVASAKAWLMVSLPFSSGVFLPSPPCNSPPPRPPGWFHAGGCPPLCRSPAQSGTWYQATSPWRRQR